MDLLESGTKPSSPLHTQMHDDAHEPESEPWMKRYFKVALVSMAVLVALALTVTRSGPAMRIGLGKITGAATADRRGYDLGALRIFNGTLMRVNDAYVDPTRV